MAITVSGTSIVFNDATTQTTAFTGGGGTVTSVATGNGLSGGTITSSGTLVIAAPSYNSVGSYIQGMRYNTGTITANTNYAAGGGAGQIRSCIIGIGGSNNLSGTWKNMGGDASVGCAADFQSVFVRVS